MRSSTNLVTWPRSVAKPKSAGGGAQQISDGILRVVRDGKGFDAHVADFKTRAALEQPPVNFGFPGVGGFEGEIGFLAPFVFESPDGGVLRGAVAIDGDVKFVRDAKDAADVVGMFVRD